MASPLRVALVLVTLGCCRAEAHEPKAHLTPVELRARIAATQRVIKAVYAVYRSGIDRSGARTSEEYYSYRVMAADSNGDFYLVATHGYSSLTWSDDPFQQNGVLRGTRFVNDNPVNRTYVELDWSPSATLPGTATKEFFMTSTGIWPFERRPAPEHLGPGRPYMLKDVARSAAYSSVMPTLESIDGRWCHVLERPGVDRLWLDADRGCVLMAREYFGPNGHLMQRFEHSGLIEHAPGVWLPRWVRNVQYDEPVPEIRTPPRLDSLVTFLEVRINSVPEGVFTYTPQRGAVKIGPSGDTVGCEPGEVEHLDHLAEWVRAYTFNPEPVPSRSPFVWALGGLLALLAGRKLLTLRSRRRALRSKSLPAPHAPSSLPPPVT